LFVVVAVVVVAAAAAVVAVVPVASNFSVCSSWSKRTDTFLSLLFL
jgi:hypothetical protein